MTDQLEDTPCPHCNRSAQESRDADSPCGINTDINDNEYWFCGIYGKITPNIQPDPSYS